MSSPTDSAASSTDSATREVTVSVNGEPRRVAEGLALDQLVTTLTTAPSGVAAALNEDVVPRSRWAATPLAEGDRVEVLTAVQGG